MPRKKASTAQKAETSQPVIKGLAIGRIVHYTMPSGAIRPALIVHVWNEQGSVNLQVFTDSDQQGTVNDRLPCPWYQTSVSYSNDPLAIGTWRMAERV